MNNVKFQKALFSKLMNNVKFQKALFHKLVNNVKFQKSFRGPVQQGTKLSSVMR